jgi:hypothetical protein
MFSFRLSASIERFEVPSERARVHPWLPAASAFSTKPAEQIRQLSGESRACDYLVASRRTRRSNEICGYMRRKTQDENRLSLGASFEPSNQIDCSG